MTSPALLLYLAASRLAGPIVPALLRRRLARGREDGARLGERLGRTDEPRPDGVLVWLHGASVGEATSALPLVSALAERGFGVLVTTGTVTAAARMAEILPEGVLHQFVPVDTAAAVRGFLDHWRPDLAIFMESELWPRLVTEAAARGTALALVNARLSEKSFRRWRLLSGMARQLFASFQLILTQDEASAGRIRALGGLARHAGNLKAMVQPPGCDSGELQAIREVLGDRPCWLAASTHEGEEEAVIAAHCTLSAAGPDTLHDDTLRSSARAGEKRFAPDREGAERDVPGRSAEAGRDAAPPAGGAYKNAAPPAVQGIAPEESGALCAKGSAKVDKAESLPSEVAGIDARSVPETGSERSPATSRAKPLLLLAPRHPDRSSEVAELLARSNLSFMRRSLGEMPGETTDVWLVDTLGEMGLWYRLAPVAFIGGSFVPVGGHTPFEPISLDTAVLHGPHIANFAPAYAALDGAGGAMDVSGAAELAAAIRGLLNDTDLAAAMRNRARETHEAMLPDLDAILDELTGLIEVPA